jgi:hypothetical protein
MSRIIPSGIAGAERLTSHIHTSRTTVLSVEKAP